MKVQDGQENSKVAQGSPKGVDLVRRRRRKAKINILRNKAEFKIFLKITGFQID